MKILLVILLFSTGGYLFAQNDTPQRPLSTIKMVIDDENILEEPIDASDYFVNDRVLQLFINEKVYVEVEVEGNVIKSMKTVKNNLHPEKTISIVFEQSVENGKHEHITLTVKNPFNKQLIYSAEMNILGVEGWHETSILPVYPNIEGIEMWGDLIVSIVLKDWKLAD